MANFWNIKYPFCNLKFLHQFLFACFPCSHCTLGFSFNLRDPFVFSFLFNGAWLFSLVEKLGENVQILKQAFWFLVYGFWWKICGCLDFALGEHGFMALGFQKQYVSKFNCFKFWKYLYGLKIFGSLHFWILQEDGQNLILEASILILEFGIWSIVLQILNKAS